MMGERQVQQDALFSEFSLERHVPERHLLRSIDRFVELDGLRRELAPFYSEMGRPSIDPELLIRMLIVGYCFGIRSERRLCEEVHLNLTYRWFCGLGLDGAVPDHSTFSKNRHGRFRDSDLLRRLFETVLQRCIDEGLVGGEGFAVDASLIAADAGDRTRVEGAAGLPPEAASRAVKEYLAVLDDAAFGAASEVTPKFIAPADPAARWTAAHRAPAFFAFDQLPDRCRQRDHRRCRSDDGDPSGRGAGGQAHGRALDGALRSISRAPDRRHRLRLGRDAGLARA
jgi:transposase